MEIKMVPCSRRIKEKNTLNGLSKQVTRPQTFMTNIAKIKGSRRIAIIT